MNILELTLYDQKLTLVFTLGPMSQETRHALDC